MLRLSRKLGLPGELRLSRKWGWLRRLRRLRLQLLKLLQLLLLSERGLVVLQIVNEFPLFVFFMFVYDMNSLPFGGAGDACDSRAPARQSSDAGWWLPRCSEDLLNETQCLVGLAGSSNAARRYSSGGWLIRLREGCIRLTGLLRLSGNNLRISVGLTGLHRLPGILRLSGILRLAGLHRLTWILRLAWILRLTWILRLAWILWLARI